MSSLVAKLRSIMLRSQTIQLGGS